MDARLLVPMRACLTLLAATQQLATVFLSCLKHLQLTLSHHVVQMQIAIFSTNCN